MMEQLGIINFPAFLIAGILLNLTPGSDTMYVLARTISLGKKAGILSALGISTGAIVHTVAAACGLSVIILSSATAFILVKYAGAVYLIYLGIKAFFQKGVQSEQGATATRLASNREIYMSGILTNVLNPKVALFFLAFLPQFISTGSQSSMLSFLILGGTFITTGTIWGVVLVVFAAEISAKISAKSRIACSMHKITGTIFIALGIRLALSER